MLKFSSCWVEFTNFSPEYIFSILVVLALLYILAQNLFTLFQQCLVTAMLKSYYRIQKCRKIIFLASSFGYVLC